MRTDDPTDRQVASEPRRRPRNLVGALVAAAVALLMVAAVIVVQPFGAAIDVAVVDLAETAFAFCGAAGCAVAIVRTRDRLRRAWVCFTLACVFWGLGQAMWTVYEVWLGIQAPFPSFADFGYLGFVPAAVAAIWLLPSRSGAGAHRRRLLDGLTVACAVTLTSWSTVLGPTVRAGADSPFALGVSLAYPVTDSLMLTVALLALAQGSRNRAPLLMVSLGMCAMALSDSAFVYLISIGSFASAGFADLGWCLAFALIGLGGLLRNPPEPVGSVGRAVVARTSVLPYVPLVLAAVMVLIQYFVGGTLDRVSMSVTSVLVGLVLARQYVTVRDNQALADTIARGEAEMRRQAFHDSLTGLANRALFSDRVACALERHRRDQRPISVAFLDLDGFKGINDMLGHAAGDEMLVQVAERLRCAVRPADTLARLGGDEFALLVEHGPEPATMARALVEACRPPFHVHGRSVAASASVGVASVGDGNPATVEDLLTRADIAMYAVKRSGRNNFLVHTPNMRLAEADDMALRQALAEALDSRQVRAVFQPILDAGTGVLIGYETLARWRNDGTDVPPDVFVPVAERMGLVATLTTLMLDHACAQLARWSAELGHSRLMVSVNVSAQELGDASLPARVLAALERHAVVADQLTLEITESALVGDPRTAHAILTRLRSLGVSIWLDDFGTGYNGFAQLIGVPIDAVKLDQVFVGDIDTDPHTRRLLEGVISLMHHLGMRVVGEGVERLEQLEVLRALGCDSVQGYLLGRPTDAANTDPRERSAHEVPIPRRGGCADGAGNRSAPSVAQ